MFTQQEIDEVFAGLGVATEEQRDRFRRLREIHRQPIGKKNSGIPRRSDTVPITLQDDDAKLGEHSWRTNETRQPS
jgi:hypothetical protein